MRPYLPLLMVIVLGGCTTVHVPEPFGDTPVALDPEEWNGTWCEPDEFHPMPGTNMLSFDPAKCATATVVDPAGGILDVVMPDDPQPQRHRVHLRHVGGDTDWIFVTLEADGGYEFVERLTHRGDRIDRWGLTEAMREEIAAGLLPGRVADGVAYLDPLAPEAVWRIALDERGEFFDWAAPQVFVRVDGGS